MLKTAGFEMKIKNTNLDNLLGCVLAGRNYDLILFAQSSTSIIPGLCTVLCTREHSHGPANDNSGNNWSCASVPAADKQMRIVDRALDDAVRKSAAKEADKLLADANVALPLDPLPEHPHLGQQGRRTDPGQRDRGHVLEHRSVGYQAVDFPRHGTRPVR